MEEARTNSTIIIDNRTNIWEYLKRVWDYRRLIKSFTYRDIRIKYAQTYFGILWSVIQAFVGVGIITFFFGYLIKIDTAGVPYFLYAFPGMAAWYFFSYIVGFSGNALVNSQYLIQKVYFPKLILPLSQALVGFVDYFIWILVCLVCVLFSGTTVTFNLFFLPVFMILNLITGLSVAIWLCALTVRFRDLQIIIPYIIDRKSVV